MQGFGSSVWAVGEVWCCGMPTILFVIGVWGCCFSLWGCCFLLVSGGLSCVVGCGVWVLGDYLFGLVVVC